MPAIKQPDARNRARSVLDARIRISEAAATAGNMSSQGRVPKLPMWQSILRRVIGYTARSTMTVMLRALEGLLWIRRKRSEDDRRQLEVELTELGRSELKRAYRRFGAGWPLMAPEWAKATRPVLEAPAASAYAMPLFAATRQTA